MKSHLRVAVIGGGVVGCSVLYHLTRLGWTDVGLIERSELTSGSTWHAAGGMHTINGDVNMSYLQGYTVRLYKELEAESGQSCGIHRVGCLYMAASELRHEFFRSERAKAHHLKLDLEFVPLAEVGKLNPLIDSSHFVAALFDPNDGHVDPSGVTQAYAKAAKKRGAEIYLRTPVVELAPTAKGGWRVVTPAGTIEADVVVNAGGLWAREVGRMAGVELPILPIEHQYIVTNNIPEVAALAREIPMTVDFEGESYLRQEHKGLLIGTYEQAPRPWAVDGTPADFGHELLPPDLDRIAGPLEIAMERYPCLREGGVKRVVNGAMVFAPDGNPLIGPVPGLANYVAACGVMAGFSQGGGVGLAVAEWIVEGEPSMDVFAMDVARFGPYANRRYVREKTLENYRRRFAMICPNEELPDARPLKTTPVYSRLAAAGALFGASYGWEYPLWYAAAGAEPIEAPSFRRSNAFGPVGEECRAVRTAAGIWETSTYSKFAIEGPNAAAWLDRIVANRLPAPGRVALCPMLSAKGRIFGDVTVARLEPDRFLMIGSPHAETNYRRWFERHAPGAGVSVTVATERWTGFSISGPNSRAILAAVADTELSPGAFRFLDARRVTVGLAPALLLRVSFAGELGWEIYVAPEHQLHVYERLLAAGRAHGLRHFGARALNSLRLEKGYGAWGREYSLDYRPGEAGLARFVRPEKGEFVGRAAAARDLAAPPGRRLSILEVAAGAVDPRGGEPVFHDGRCTGRVTSGGYGHWVGKSIALTYLPADVAAAAAGFGVEILGERYPARRMTEPHYDPNGERLRG
jgi:dimethylglycine dehydrogenase